jgi:hypothetical protein
MQSLLIVGLSVLACVLFGIAHDQVTARICVEYFTIGHPPLFRTTSPTLLGLGWGVAATWWVGLILGVLLALASRAGRRPKRDARTLVRPIAILMLVCGVCAVAAGLLGHHFASENKFRLLEPLASDVPEERHVDFLAVMWAHTASYGAAFVGGLVLVVLVCVGRARAARRAQET